MTTIKKKTGKPIKGNMKPFLIKEYVDTRSIVLGRSESYNDFYKFRTICKNLVVDRWRTAARNLNEYRVLPLSEIESHLRSLGESEELIHFLMCLFNYYSYVNQCTYFVNQAECLKSAEPRTTIQATIQDVKKLMTTDVVKVMQRLNTVTTMQKIDFDTIQRQYKLLQETVAIFQNTFKMMYHQELPERLASEHYDMVIKLDSKITNYYTKDNISYVVKTKKKKPIYKRLNSDAAFILSLAVVACDKKKRCLYG